MLIRATTQQLKADVVTNVTAFYTYMKVVRDGLRKLKDMPQPSAGTAGDNNARRCVLRNVIYMQFLGLESGRKAIRDLVEFESTQAEETCAILLSELVAYRFLRGQFSDDLRQRRLNAREVEHRRTIPILWRKVEAGSGRRWEKAKGLAKEVVHHYAKVYSGEPKSSEAHSRKSCAPVVPAGESVAA